MNLEFLTAKIEIPQSFELGFVKLVFDNDINVSQINFIFFNSFIQNVLF